MEAAVEGDARQAVANHTKGRAFPLVVWFAVLGELAKKGCVTDEELDDISVDVVGKVVLALSSKQIPVSKLFVEKVVASRLNRKNVPFGPPVVATQGRAAPSGAGSRTFSEDDLDWIDELLDLNGREGISLTLLDICTALFDHRGVQVSETTLGNVFKQERFSKKRGQARAYMKFTPENMAYYWQYCYFVYSTFVATGTQRLLRFLDESSFDSADTGGKTFWGPMGGQYHHKNHGARGKKFSVLGVTACNAYTHAGAPAKQPLMFDILDGNMDAAYFTAVVTTWLDQGYFSAGDTVVMDNGSAHSRNEEFHALLGVFQEHHVRLVRLPVYSPELNPIEQLWNTTKLRMRRGKQSRPNEFVHRLRQTLLEVDFDDVIAQMKDRGY
jgi:hypothetical protein